MSNVAKKQMSIILFNSTVKQFGRWALCAAIIFLVVLCGALFEGGATYTNHLVFGIYTTLSSSISIIIGCSCLRPRVVSIIHSYGILHCKQMFVLNVTSRKYASNRLLKEFSDSARRELFLQEGCSKASPYGSGERNTRCLDNTKQVSIGTWRFLYLNNYLDLQTKREVMTEHPL